MSHTEAPPSERRKICLDNLDEIGFFKKKKQQQQQTFIHKTLWKTDCTFTTLAPVSMKIHLRQLCSSK